MQYLDYYDLIYMLSEQGMNSNPRGIAIKELINEHMQISNNHSLICVPGIRDVTDPLTKEGQYLRAEFVWYMSGSLSVNYISRFGSMWNKLTNQFEMLDSNFCKEETRGNINSNYGNRVFYSSPAKYVNDVKKESDDGYIYDNSYEWICNELKNDRDSRKAIIQYTTPYMYLSNVRDFTCTQTQQFLIRDNILFNLVNIRSSDAIKGLSFDIPWWNFVGQSVASRCDATCNIMFINIGSSHFYLSDKNLIDNLISNENDFKMKTLDLIFKYNADKWLKLRNLCKDIDSYFTSFDKQFNSDIQIKRILDLYNYGKIDVVAKAISYLLVTLVEKTSQKYYVDKNILIKFNNEIFDIFFNII